MRAITQTKFVLALALALGLAGCTPFRKKAQTPPPPPPVQQPVMQEPPPAPAPQAKPMEEPQLPSSPLPPPEVEPTVIRPKLDQVEPPKTPQPARRRSRRTPSAKQQPKPAETAPTVQAQEQPPAETPAQPPQTTAPKPEIKLAEVLSEEQRRDYNQTIDESLGEARRGLASLQGRTLTREQSENESRVRTFIRQAEESRETDIRAAAQFSRRAVLLARELLDTLKK